ncbi:hypothetical protein BH23VER1_BH23VER1_28610 [soil metagenome]
MNNKSEILPQVAQKIQSLFAKARELQARRRRPRGRGVPRQMELPLF